MLHKALRNSKTKPKRRENSKTGAVPGTERERERREEKKEKRKKERETC